MSESEVFEPIPSDDESVTNETEAEENLEDIDQPKELLLDSDPKLVEDVPLATLQARLRANSSNIVEPSKIYWNECNRAFANMLEFFGVPDHILAYQDTSPSALY